MAAATFSLVIRAISVRAGGPTGSDFHQPECDNLLRIKAELRPSIAVINQELDISVPLLRAARSYYAKRRAFALLDFRHVLSMCHGWVCGGNGGGLFVLVWFSDDRRLKVLVLLGVLILLVIIIIIVVGSRGGIVL